MQTEKVWQLLDSSSIGGIETHVVHLSRELKALRIPNQIVRLKSYGHHPVFDSQENRDLDSHCCSGIMDLIRLCVTTKPKVIHAHGTKACLVAKFLRVFTRQKIICTYHTGETGVGLQGIYDRLNQLTAFIGHSIAVSDPIASKLLGNNCRIDNFIPVPEYHEASTRKCIAFVGRLSHEKGPDRFLELCRLCPYLNFRIYGKGPLIEHLESIAPSNLQFVTDVSNMDSHWDEIDLLCITSREEGLPLVALEAMARGICVVSFPVGGLPSLIEHGINGFLLESQSVIQLNTFLQKYMELDAEHKSEIQINARRVIQKRYSSEALVPQINDLYRMVCKEAS